MKKLSDSNKILTLVFILSTIICLLLYFFIIYITEIASIKKYNSELENYEKEFYEYDLKYNAELKRIEDKLYKNKIKTVKQNIKNLIVTENITFFVDNNYIHKIPILIKILDYGYLEKCTNQLVAYYCNFLISNEFNIALSKINDITAKKINVFSQNNFVLLKSDKKNIDPEIISKIEKTLKNNNIFTEKVRVELSEKSTFINEENTIKYLEEKSNIDLNLITKVIPGDYKSLSLISINKPLKPMLIKFNSNQKFYLSISLFLFFILINFASYAFLKENQKI